MIVKSTADILKPNDIRAYFEARPVQPRFYKALLTPRTTTSIEFEIIKNAGAKVTLAHVQPFNKPSHKSGRDGVEGKIERMDPIKEGYVLDEKLYREYKKSATDPMVIKGMFDDIGNSYDSVENKIEAMTMEMYSTGKIAINDAGYVRNVDMLVPGDNKVTLTGTDKWSNADADILGDLMDLLEMVKYPAGAKILTSRKIVTYMLKNNALKKLAFGDSASFSPMSLTQLNSLLGNYDIPAIAVNEATTWYYDATGKKAEKRYWPENILTIIPGNSGELAMGDTVEEIAGTNLVAVRNKIALVQYETVDPYTITTMASALQFPYLVNADKTVILQPID